MKSIKFKKAALEVKVMVNKYDVDEQNTRFDKKNILRLLSYTKNHRFKLFVTFLLSAVATILSLFTTKILQIVLDEVIVQENMKKLLLYTLIEIVLTIVIVLFTKLKDQMLAKINLSIIYDLKNDLFAHIQYLSADYFDTRPHGKILVRVTEYTEQVSSLITNQLVNTIMNFINLIFVLIFMFTTNVSLTWITLVGVLILVMVFASTSKIKRTLRQDINNKKANSNAYLVESLKGISTTQAFNRETTNETIYRDLTSLQVDAANKIRPYSNLGWFSIGNISSITTCAIYFIGIKILYPNISVGTIAAMGSYSERFWSPIRSFFNTIDSFIETMTYLERILETIDEEIKIKNSEHPQNVNLSGHIVFDNVYFSYDGKRNVLNGIAFEILPGEKIAIVGETGSGKTTITNLLARFYDISSGGIYFDGIEIKDIDLYSLRRQVTIMQQDNFLFSDTIMHNLKYGNENISDKQVYEVCEKLEMDAFIRSLPEGYNTVLENNGKTISEGQRQLLSYARVILNDPKVLVLDEATSKIDVQTEKLIQTKVKDLLKDKTTITIAHRLSTITDSDKILFIKDSVVKEEGTHKELMHLKGDYYKLYMSQYALYDK